MTFRRIRSLDWSFHCAAPAPTVRIATEPWCWRQLPPDGSRCSFGAWSQPFGRLGITHGCAGRRRRDLLLQRTSHWTTLCHVFALAGAIGTGLPTQHLDWWHAASRSSSQAVASPRSYARSGRPEQIRAVPSAQPWLPREQRSPVSWKSVGGPDEDAAWPAAVSLHAPGCSAGIAPTGRSADDGTLTRLRSISRELHRLFVDGINAGWSLRRPACVVPRPHDLAARGPRKLPLPHERDPNTCRSESTALAEASGKPRMAISHSGRLAPRRPGGGNSGISGSRTGPGMRLLDRSRRRSHSSPRLGLDPESFSAV